MGKVFSGLLKKLKSIKHIEIILAVLFGLIILLVYFSSTSSMSNKDSQTRNIEVSGVNLYTLEVENKLENLISQIEGAGKVKVMVMCEDNVDLTTDKTPKIVSAVVVASGAEKVQVKLEIIKAVETLLNLNSARIEVINGLG